MNNPLVSIIIPTFNRAHLIGETLDSILAQTYLNWECIVVDDGSTDNSAEVLTSYLNKDSRFQYHLRPDSIVKGGNACRNYGFSISQGAYVNWFDDDDLMHPEKLQKQVEQLEKSNYEYSICQTLLFEGTIRNVKGLLHDKIVSEKPFEDFLRRNIVWLTQAPLFKRSFLTTMEYLFDEALLAAQEWEFFCRVLWKNPAFFATNEALVYNRQHSERLGTVKSFENKRLYHYYLAKVKVENFLLKQGNTTYKDFFTTYYLQMFRLLILNKETKFSAEIVANTLKKRIPGLQLAQLRFASWVYLKTGRGYNLLKTIVG